MRLRASLIAALPLVLGLATACSIYDTSLLLDAAPTGAGGQAGDGQSEGGEGGEAGDSGEGGEAGTGDEGGAAGEAGAGGDAGEGGAAGDTSEGGAGGAAGDAGNGGAGGDAECNDPSDCDDQQPCTADSCQDGTCIHTNDDTFKPEQTAGNCKNEVCSGGKLSSTPNDTDKPADDGNTCTVEACTSGEVSTKTLADNTACTVGSSVGVCKSGACAIECSKDADCDDKNACTTNACTNNKCVFTNVKDGTATPGVSVVSGDCKSNVCQGGIAVDVADPLDLPASQACKDVACNGMTPGVVNKADGADCSSGGNGFLCIAGACKAPACGDGIKTGSEACDKTDLGGQSCTGLGMSSGQLACKADCTLDTSKCTGSCGDGKVDAGEECDDSTTPAAAGSGCSALCTIEPAVGDLVITEVMINPEYTAGSDDGEWFEVYNKSTKTLDLRNLVIASGADSVVIAGDSPIKLAPGAYGVFVRYADTKKNGGLTFLFSYENKINFSNSSADDVSISIATSPQTLIDKVEWAASIGGSTKYKGISYSLDKSKLDAALNDVATNWCPAKTQISATNTDKGTPGLVNDGCP